MVRKNTRGFSLLELCVAMAIMVALMLMASMSVSYWSDSTNMQTTKGSMQEGFMRMRAMALRNPLGATGGTTASSTLSLTSSSKLVLCQGNGGCASPTWSSQLPTGVQIQVGGSALNCLSMSSGGDLITGANSCNTGGSTYTITSKSGGVINGNF